MELTLKFGILYFLSIIFFLSNYLYANSVDCNVLLKSFFQDEKMIKKSGAQIQADKSVTFSIYLRKAIRVQLITELNWDKKIDLKYSEKRKLWSVNLKNAKHSLKYKMIVTGRNQKQYEVMDPRARSINQGDENLDPESRGGQPWHSIVWDPNRFKWSDQKFKRNPIVRAEQFYFGTYFRGKQWINYRELVDLKIKEWKKEGFTYVQLMPINHHNVVKSWGYQAGVPFAIDHRHGNPDDFKYFVNKCHEVGIGVLGDLVISHTSMDRDTGLGGIDGGEELYVREDIMKEHPKWKTLQYNYDDPYVQNYLISILKYYKEELHLDGVRIDGVASMIYLDYERKSGEWIPAFDGSNINYGALDTLKKLNAYAHYNDPTFLTIAEFSGEWDKETKPVEVDGLGFDYKWGMEGMHDMREFLETTPQNRDMNQLFVSLFRDTKEINYLNSHDEASEPSRLWANIIAGLDSEDQMFRFIKIMNAHLVFALPGGSMTFHGDSIANKGDDINPHWWNEKTPIGRELLAKKEHQQVQKFFEYAFGKVLLNEQAFKRQTKDASNLMHVDNSRKVYVMARYGFQDEDHLLVLMNASSSDHHNYRIPVLKSGGKWRVILNSEAKEFGGRGININVWQHPDSLTLTLPRESFIILKYSHK